MAKSPVFYRYIRGLPQASLLFAFFCVVFIASSALGADYDISYLWHSDRASVASYKTRVAKILGPDVAGKLRLVRGSENYGLIYRRSGGLESAKTVAAAHSRLLTDGGLKPAIWIEARDWASPESPETAPAVRCGPASSPLESDIENYIKKLRKRGVIRQNERTAWIVYDLSSDKKLVSINEDIPLEAASLIKPFVALAYFHEVEAGRKSYSDEARRRMVSMIRDSNNAATNWFFRRLGGPAAVQRLLSGNYGAILSNTRIVEYIPTSGRTYRNKASAHDYSRFLYALWNDTLPRSVEIKRLMNLSNPDRLYTATPGVPEGTEVYDKTGTTSHLCGNMGILVAKNIEDGGSFPYIIVGVIEKEKSAQSYFNWMRTRGDVIRRVSEMVYKEIAGRPRSEDSDSLNAGKSSGGSSAKTAAEETK
ncbi:MAG: serine hydrolase [bacterium]